jgi:ABC-type Mn2+/Zn2+ transport system permease subunit
MAETYSIVLALATAVAAGLVGSFALMKRMSLAGDVVSHIALPGIGLAIAYHANPLLGAAVALFIGALLIWRLQTSSSLTADTAIGVVFTAAIALGVLLTTEEELIEALFGGFEGMTLRSFILGIAAVLAIIGFIFKFRNQLIVATFSPELAEANGLNVSRLNLYYLLIFSLTVLLGLRFLGALLVGALIIIPAAIGRQLAHTLGAFLTASCIASVISIALGFLISFQFGTEVGPTIVTASAALFGLSLLKRKD